MQVHARDCSCGGEMSRLKMTNSILQLGVSPVALTDKQAWLLAAQKALLALQVDALDDGDKELLLKTVSSDLTKPELLRN